jgi:hypothetical protein
MLEKNRVLAEVQKHSIGLTGEKKDVFNFVYHLMNNMNPNLLESILFDWNRGNDNV